MCGAITFGEYAHTTPKPNAIFLHFRIYCLQYLSFGFNSRPLFMIFLLLLLLLFFTAANEILYTFMCVRFVRSLKVAGLHNASDKCRQRTSDSYTHGTIGCQTAAHSITADAILEQQSARVTLF